MKLKTVPEIQRFIGLCLAATKLSSSANEYGGPFDKDDLAVGAAFGVDLKALEKKAALVDAPKRPAKAVKVQQKKALKAGAGTKSRAAAA